MVISKWRVSVLLHSLTVYFLLFWRNSYLLIHLCQNKIDINMIKIFLQNLSASKFKKSNFTNHRERRIVNLLINKFIGMNEFLSFSSDQAWPWPWWRVSCARGVCVTMPSIILLIPGTWYDTTSLSFFF